MRIVHIVLVTVAFLLASSAVSAQDVKKKSNEAQVVFSVSMDCHSCEQKIVNNLGRSTGVRDLSTDLKKQLVTIKYQPNRTDVAKLKAAIEKLGFTCTEVVKPDSQKEL